MNELKAREHQALMNLIPAAKAAVNVLKDHKMSTTASELEAALFAVESVKDELNHAIKGNPAAFMDALLRALKDD